MLDCMAVCLPSVASVRPAAAGASRGRGLWSFFGANAPPPHSPKPPSTRNPKGITQTATKGGAQLRGNHRRSKER